MQFNTAQRELTIKIVYYAGSKPTKASVKVSQWLGSPGETSHTYTVNVRKAHDEAPIATIQVPPNAGVRRPRLENEVLLPQFRFLGDHHSALDCVLQFAHVSGPGMLLQDVHGAGRDAGDPQTREQPEDGNR